MGKCYRLAASRNQEQISTLSKEGLGRKLLSDYSSILYSPAKAISLHQISKNTFTFNELFLFCLKYVESVDSVLVLSVEELMIWMISDS